MLKHAEHPPAPRSTPARLPTVILALLASSAGAGVLGEHSDGYEHAAMLRAEAGGFDRFDPAEDGPQNLSAQVLLQTRYLASTRSNPIGANSRGQTYGFDVPRAQVRLSGNLINRQLTGYLTFDFGDAEGDRGRGRVPSVPAGNGSPQLREAYVQYNFEGSAEGMYVKVGQFKSSVITEDAIAPEYQLAVERSVTNEFFSLGLTQGLAIGRLTDRFAWEVSINDGHRYLGNPEPANTSFNDSLEADWGVSGRFDWKMAGDWARFADLASWRGSDEGIKVGAGVHFQRQGDTNPDQIPSDYLATAQELMYLGWTADIQYESDGWSLFAAYHGNRIELESDLPGVGRLVFVQHGWVLQASYFLGDQVEVFGRYDGLIIDDIITEGFGTGENQYDYLTAGVNYYFIPESHAVKFTADVVFTRSNSETFDTGNPSSIFYPDASVTGLLGAADQELLFRAQMQMLF